MDDFVELRHVIIIILRRWWLLAAATAFAAMIGFTISKAQPKVYQATATLIVGRLIESTELDRDDILISEILARNYADLATRQPVLNAVVENLDLSQNWRQLRSDVHVGLRENTNLLEITVEASSPEQARMIADEISDQLILLSPNESQTHVNIEDEKFVRQQLESLRTLIESGQERYIIMQEELAGDLPQDERIQLSNELTTLGRLIIEWEKNYAELLPLLNNNQSSTHLTLIEPAQARSSPIRPVLLLNIVISGGVGLALAIGAVLAMEFYRGTIQSKDERPNESLKDSHSISLEAVGEMEGDR